MSSEVLDLEAGKERLHEMVLAAAAKRDGGNAVVLIAGGTCSGKTSRVAHGLKERLGDDVLLFPSDAYYKGKVFMAEQAEAGIHLNYDQPEALDLEGYRNDLEALRRGEAVPRKRYDMRRSLPVESDGMIEPKPYIVADGLFTLHDSVRGVGDVHAFVEAGRFGRLVRRLVRDQTRKGFSPGQILEYVLGVVDPMHEAHVQPTREHAGLVIQNGYNPLVERYGEIDRPGSCPVRCEETRFSSVFGESLHPAELVSLHQLGGEWTLTYHVNHGGFFRGFSFGVSESVATAFRAVGVKRDGS